MRYLTQRFSLICLCFCFGCGREAGLEGMIRVSGMVNYRGVPVEGATVVFAPESEGGGRAASGITDPKGRFNLTTLRTNDGARPGNYRVTVSKGDDFDPETQVTAEQMTQMISGGAAAPMGPTRGRPRQSSNAKQVIPAKYSDRKTSGLQAQVVQNDTNDFVFDLSD